MPQWLFGSRHNLNHHVERIFIFIFICFDIKDIEFLHGKIIILYYSSHTVC